MFLGVVFTAVALWQLGERLDNGSGHIAPLFLAGCVIYGAIGYIARPGWCGSFSAGAGQLVRRGNRLRLGWGAYWLGMNYPIRFVLFGGALLALCYGAQSCFASGSCLPSARRWASRICLLRCCDHVDFRQLRRRQLVP